MTFYAVQICRTAKKYLVLDGNMFHRTARSPKTIPRVGSVFPSTVHIMNPSDTGDRIHQNVCARAFLVANGVQGRRFLRLQLLSMAEFKIAAGVPQEPSSFVDVTL